jgi:hypothetical protein
MAQESLANFIQKASIGLTVCWLLTLVPSPVAAVPFVLKNGLVSIGFVLYVGKLLYDTLFYDRTRL